MRQYILILLCFIWCVKSYSQQETADSIINVYSALLQDGKCSEAENLIRTNKHVIVNQYGDFDYCYAVSLARCATYIAQGYSKEVLKGIYADTKIVLNGLLNTADSVKQTYLEDWGNFIIFSSRAMQFADSADVELNAEANNWYISRRKAEGMKAYYYANYEIVDLLYQAHDYQRALDINAQTINTAEQYKDTLCMALSYYYQGVIYQAISKNSSNAIECISKADELFKSSREKDNLVEYKNVKKILADYYLTCRNYSKGDTFAQENYRLSLLQDGKGSFRHIESLVMLAMSDEGLLKYEEAYEKIKEAKELSSTTENIDSALKSMVDMQYARISVFTKHGKVVQDQETLSETANASNINNHIVEFYNCISGQEFDRAISIGEKIIPFYLLNIDAFNVDNLISVSSDLSNCYAHYGNYAQADSLLSIVGATIEQTGIKTDMARHLFAAQGLIYYYMRNFHAARQRLSRAKRIFEAINDRSRQYALVLGNLSVIYAEFGENLKAKLFAEEALYIIKQSASNERDIIDYGMFVNNIAYTYGKIGCNQEAISLLEEYLPIIIESGDLRSSLYIKLNLGEYYIKEGKLKKGADVLQEVLRKDNLIDLELKRTCMQDYVLASKLLHDDSYLAVLHNYNEEEKEYFASIISHFSETEWEGYWNYASQILVALNNMTVDGTMPEVQAKMAFDNSLYIKSLLLHASQIIDNEVKKNANGEIAMLYNYINSLKQTLITKGIPEDSLTVVQIELINKQKQLLQAINIKEVINQGVSNFEDITKSLDENEVAIEFTYMPRIENTTSSSWQGRFGALIARKGAKAPIVVELCVVDDFDEYVDSLTTSNNYGLYHKKDNSIYSMLWEKLTPYLKKNDIVYYSTIGSINNVNHAAISTGNGLLSDMYDLRLLSSTAQIRDYKRQKGDSYHTAAIYGGINYDEPIDEMLLAAQPYKECGNGEDLALLRSMNTRGNWSNLPATMNEAKEITQILKENNIRATLYTGNGANEESFKALGGKDVSILHIATHGYCVDTPAESNGQFLNGVQGASQRDMSMYCSGLLFAGANNTWRGNAPKDAEDGILTAEELSRLDLRKTKIAVLSACKTGLGDTGYMDGVYGLQRALKRAGAQSVIMSLWSVDDEVTSHLMKTFYGHLVNGSERHEAFKKSIKDIKKQYANPKYWAAFVMLD